MIKKVNYKKIAIDKLMEQYGKTRAEAVQTWNRAYQKAVRQMRKVGANKQINMTREVQASMFNRGTTMFNINVLEDSPKVKIKTQYLEGNALVNFTKDKMSSFFKKYPEANSIMTSYEKGEITFDQFKVQIKNFQDMNPEYKSQNYENHDNFLI